VLFTDASEEKAKLLRMFSSKIEEKNEALDNFLVAVKLEDLNIHVEAEKIPQV